MYTKKKPEDLDCGIEVAIKVFISKWKPCLLDCIHKGTRRPSEIHRALPNATPRVLNMQLKELEQYQVVNKKIYPGLPPKVEYYLTEMGKSIIPIVEQMNEWGKKNNEQIKKITEMQKILDKIKI
jgi:DNA-binding HxlR family transcriptional regulator